MFTYRLLRYVPDTVKGEFVNIGVVLTDPRGRFVASRMAGDEDLRRARCLHPRVEMDLLRAWQAAVEESMGAAPEDAAAWLASLDDSSSHALAWTAAAGCELLDPTAALQQLYESFVASPPRAPAAMRPSTGAWIKREAEAVLRAERLLERLETAISVRRFTGPGDPFRIHYAYSNGRPRYIHMLSLERSVQQAKVLAFTFDRIRAAGPAEMTAVVEPNAPPVETVQFTRGLLEASAIEVLPLDHIYTLVRRAKADLGMPV